MYITRPPFYKSNTAVVTLPNKIVPLGFSVRVYSFNGWVELQKYFRNEIIFILLRYVH